MTLAGTALNLGEKMKIYPSGDVLHKNSNLAISCCYFADDGKEMDNSEKHTYSAYTAIAFYH